MPGGFPANQEGAGFFPLGQNLSTSGVTLVTAPSTINTKSAWVAFGTISVDCDFLTIFINTGGGYVFGLVDIGIGVPGSETVLISNLPFPDTINSFHLPVKVPAGTKLSVRAQATVANQAVQVGIYCRSGGFFHMPGFDNGEGVGVTFSSYCMTMLTAGASNTKGVWAILAASTIRDYSSIVMYNWILTSGPCLFDLATGVSGHEVVLASNMSFGSCFLPLFIPKGTRLVARCQNPTASSNALASLIGLY